MKIDHNWLLNHIHSGYISLQQNNNAANVNSTLFSSCSPFLVDGFEVSDSINSVLTGESTVVINNTNKLTNANALANICRI